MLKKLLMLMAMLYAAVAFAAVDINKATVAELDGIKGIGPSISGKILEERKKGDFKDWNDLIGRVSGIGETSAARFSASGLTINGNAYSGPPAKKAPEARPAANTKEAAATAKKDAPMAPAVAPMAAASSAKK
ncbi:MAG: helix-hairpin-helix domain-containing protein [Simplicispira sp.]|uniref:ComEA family DNA-binding protein n=1 Tax=Simplicispira sp. TaxID=2015802 RepID=UPI002582B633|nr:helix-hairpin-helix domain-containing protein [Simplicispira sp.]MDD2691440.1 helix-hairpin-helix domain-containing protein [Simplicispira sp.]